MGGLTEQAFPAGGGAGEHSNVVEVAPRPGDFGVQRLPILDSGQVLYS